MTELPVPLDDADNQSKHDNNQAEDQTSLETMQADMQAALLQKQQASDSSDQDKSSDDLQMPTDEDGNIILDEVQTSRVIEMAWEDRTPFGAIEHSYGLDESAVIRLMRQEMKPSSFKMWRERVTGRNTKHEAKRDFEVGRAYCKTQYKPR